MCEEEEACLILYKKCSVKIAGEQKAFVGKMQKSSLTVTCSVYMARTKLGTPGCKCSIYNRMYGR